MNSEKSKTSYPHVLLFDLTDKIDLREEKIIILLHQILVVTIHQKI